jgi:hypothetical protein
LRLGDRAKSQSSDRGPALEEIGAAAINDQKSGNAGLLRFRFGTDERNQAGLKTNLGAGRIGGVRRRYLREGTGSFEEGTEITVTRLAGTLTGRHADVIANHGI